MTTSTFEIAPQGRFDLAASARFIAGWPPADQEAEADGDVRLAFLADDFSGAAGVWLRQPGGPDTPVVGEVVEPDPGLDLDAVRTQAARVVSLDHDGTGWVALGERDPVLGERMRAGGWLRPVLFHSPYEAACRAIISLRLRAPQVRAVLHRLGDANGRTIEVGGQALRTFAAPEALLGLQEIEGLNAEKVRRLHGVAEAALAGELEREALLALGHEAGRERLLELRGVGPFWADLIYLRAVGPTNGVALGEPRVRALAAAAYGRPEVEDDDAAFLALSAGWEPFRTWASVLLRASG